MARIDDDPPADRETSLVFIACNVGEAKRAEGLLTERNVDYWLSFEPFVRSGIFAGLFDRQENVGVGFTVASDVAAVSRDLLREHGLRAGVVEDEW